MSFGPQDEVRKIPYEARRTGRSLVISLQRSLWTEETVPESITPIEARLSQTLRDYWLERVTSHTTDSYLGVPLSKFPEDLRTYEHLLWESRANVVVEAGSQWGGSALWFRDRLATLEHHGLIKNPKVISMDLDVSAARENLSWSSWNESDITFLAFDIRDDDVVAAVAEHLPAQARCLVIDDSAHTYETTLASLRHLSGFVPVGGYFVVEDGCVDIEAMRLTDEWPSGVLPAVDTWLAEAAGKRFTLRRDLERYILTCHPRGFLQRTS